jgi:hypothetical protein
MRSKRASQERAQSPELEREVSLATSPRTQVLGGSPVLDITLEVWKTFWWSAGSDCHCTDPTVR